MINIRIANFQSIPSLKINSVSSKSTYSISSSKSSAIANNSSSLSTPNYLPSSFGLPIPPPQNGQNNIVSFKRSNRSNKYPETFVDAIKAEFPVDLVLRTYNGQSSTRLQGELLSKINKLAHEQFNRQLPEESLTSIAKLGELIKAYRIAVSNRTALERKNVSPDTKGGQMKAIALKTLGKKDFQNLSPEEQLDYYVITGNTVAILDLIKAEENSIMVEAGKIPNSDQKKAEFSQFGNSLSKLIEYFVGDNNIVPFVKQGSLV